MHRHITSITFTAHQSHSRHINHIHGTSITFTAQSFSSIHTFSSIHYHVLLVVLVLLVFVFVFVLLVLGLVVLRIVCHHPEAHAQVTNLPLNVPVSPSIVFPDVVVRGIHHDLDDALVQNADFGTALQCILGIAFLVVTHADLQVHAHHARVLFGEVLAMLAVQVQLVLQALVVARKALKHFVFVVHAALLNHCSAAHGALVAVGSAVRHVSDHACKVELVAAVQAHEVASGVGDVKADRTAIV